MVPPSGSKSNDSNTADVLMKSYILPQIKKKGETVFAL